MSSKITRRVVGIASAAITMFLMSGSMPAFAHRLEDDTFRGPIPAAPAAPAAASGGASWITLIVVVAVVAASAALVGTLRFRRTRAIAAGA